MPKLDSTAVHRVEYTPTTHTLDIWYAGGNQYSYFDVPASVYEALLAATSTGAFVNSEIKPHFRFLQRSRLERSRFRPSEPDYKE